MIAYVTVGADDIPIAKRFYNAILPALGFQLEEGPEGLSYALPVPAGQRPLLPDFYVTMPQVWSGERAAFHFAARTAVFANTRLWVVGVRVLWTCGWGLPSMFKTLLALYVPAHSCCLHAQFLYSNCWDVECLSARSALSSTRPLYQLYECIFVLFTPPWLAGCCRYAGGLEL